MFSGFDIFCKDDIKKQTLKCFQDLKYFVRMKFKHICSNVFMILIYSKDEIQTWTQILSGFEIFLKMKFKHKHKYCQGSPRSTVSRTSETRSTRWSRTCWTKPRRIVTKNVRRSWRRLSREVFKGWEVKFQEN